MSSRSAQHSKAASPAAATPTPSKTRDPITTTTTTTPGLDQPNLRLSDPGTFVPAATTTTAATATTTANAATTTSDRAPSISSTTLSVDSPLTSLRTLPAASGTANAQAEDVNAAAAAAKKKQKRNKPTLSCGECVERKTKCDRTRPACLACIKRQSSCRYSEIADLIAANGNGKAGLKSKKQSKHQANAPKSATGTADASGLPTPTSVSRSKTLSAQASPFLLSNFPSNTQASPPLHVFGSLSTQHHPFSNYWTTQGGIPEVIGVLPTKDQADTLVAKYFEAVDPVFPMLHKESFYAEYDTFWTLSHEEKCYADASVLALQFTIYALGAQFLQMESDQARQQISEFYVSAAHQSLRLYPFLSRTSLRSIEAMVLMGYFLMNDNKATDAWAFSGILVKQSYAMGLHRDPNIIAPKASILERNQRRKVWQAVFCQDTFFTVLVKLPPTTTFSDVSVDSLTEDMVEADQDVAININPMSISAIAPRQLSPPIPPPPPTSATTKSDTAYIRAMWRLAELVQRTICQPRALAQPLTTSHRQKSQLLHTFHSLYASLPVILTDTRPQYFQSLAASSPRVARQSLFLRSNFWHCVMLIEADANEAAGVQCDIRATLEAARTALRTFFDCWDVMREDASVWWVLQHRAFEDALTMSSLLAAYDPNRALSHAVSSGIIDALFHEAREDVRRVLDILEKVGSAAPEMQRTRTGVLRTAFESIVW